MEKKHLGIELANAAARGKPAPFDYQQLSKTLVAHLCGYKRSGFQAEVNATSFESVCWNCGAKGHTFKDCTAKCGACGLRFCGGARIKDQRCMLVLYGLGKNPVDSAGNPLPEYVVKKIKQRANEMHEDGSMAKKLARAKGRKEICLLEDSDEDKQELDETNICSLQEVFYNFSF